MKYYIEITLMDHPDMGIYELWGKLYTQIHLALVEQQNQQGKVSMGISFPEYRYESKMRNYLGGKMRIFAQDEVDLQQLDITKWLSKLSNYLHTTGISAVPALVAKYVQFRRQHVKGNHEKLARRRAKRHNLNLDQAMKFYPNKIYCSDLPYIQLKSLTTGHLFKICIEKREHSDCIQNGFNTYGLSDSSTVPEF